MHIGKCELCGKETEYKFLSRVKRFCSYECSNKSKWLTREKGERKNIDCEVCKKQFSLLGSELRVRGKVRFCSIICMGEAKKKPESKLEVFCKTCGTKFIKRKDHVAENNYCSKLCSGIAKRKRGTWSETDPDKEAKKKYHQEYQKNNREKINKLSSDWGKRNRAYKNYIQHVRRAAGELTYDEWKEIINNAGCCTKCGSTERLEIDHIVAVSKGGKTEKSNLQVLCRTCNATKGDR